MADLGMFAARFADAVRVRESQEEARCPGVPLAVQGDDGSWVVVP
jgi:hypothetical protein